MERFLNKELLPEHVYEKLVSTYEYIATELCKDTYENGLPYYMFGYNNREIVIKTIFIQLLVNGEIEMLKNIDAQLSGLQYKKDAHLFLKKLPETYQELSKKHELSYYEKRLLDFLKENPNYRKIEASNLLTTFANGVVTGASAVFNAFIDSED
ncbi:hypothetical protein REG_1743 [Candidatus Regiella insecticola LSR1]|uniref:Uncharacterized protein n=1 Tax=Candidatus Regiella insecticola LSR1 TaxID=663321 RepID=E0WUG2_9ENTR|nr:hypothetical protein [Candidatus Regiella insecticola]EFL91350.1 hypothetical protein REG_1743 [Candidatus Regiella insecticola LSR1]